MDFFDHQSIFFTVLGYPMSYLEFFGTIAGAIAVFLSAKANVWSWPLGIINVVLFFFLFYQVQLYPDMFLQVFFFITNLLGWYRWMHPQKEEEDGNKQLKITRLSFRWWIGFGAIGLIGTFLFGRIAQNLNSMFPFVFSQPSAFPYADSFVTIMSIVATYLMVQKKLECWLVWILVDVVACGLYFSKGILFVGIEYVVFCFIAAFGFWYWLKEFREA
ncbi:MAG: nicotinamide riboside transporter PnuC [Cyclobacteriaceae bacterium]|jgi:nicotinamide mononucleotide transporter|nr:nicotinamide riboside transporter PnuC [Flammeovirgaceae bacterium]